MRRVALFTAVAAAALVCTEARAQAVSPLVVTAITPLSDAPAAGDGAAAVQVATGEDIRASHAIDLAAFLARETGGVYVNDVQNNPLQPDLNYRGYTASPLLGSPQGLSVYLDGVRLNQPFGDVVSWDLIPRVAISSVTLAPGPNPLFGLNTLGGAFSIRTKDGTHDKGAALGASYGSYGRRLAEAEIGGRIRGDLNGYLAASTFGDDGWRRGSPSDASQLFGKLGWSRGDTELGLTAAYADSELYGNGLQDQQLLARDWRSIYTQPDITRNHSALVNLTARHRFSKTLSFSGNLYARTVRTRTLNGDVNDDVLGESPYQPSAAEQRALIAAGYTGFPLAGETQANTPFPAWRCLANALLNTEPNEKCDGLLNRSRTNQKEAGASGQFVLTGHANALTVGAAYNASRAAFVQSSQFGYITADHGVTGVLGPGAFADGSQDSENAFDARVDLTGRARTASLYASDTLAVTDALRLTLAGRYDRTTVRNRDRLTPGGGLGSLDGDHRFSRFNPSVGATYALSPGLTAYAGYNQASRAPSAIELGCADPDNPCRLPNAMAGAPPLKAVRARTLEAGLRGQAGQRLSWRLGAFRARNLDDILFVADDAAGFGYFKNFGETRRQGVEAGLNARLGRIRLDASYTLLGATYRSAETVGGEANSANDGAAPGFEGDIEIAPGDRIPLIPRHLFKAGVKWSATRSLEIDADLIGMSGVYARGNENNAHQPDGLYYLGRGKTPGYVVVNLGVEYRLGGRLTLYGQADNLLDRRYYNAAQLGATAFNAAGAVEARPFVGPVVGGERPLRNVSFVSPGAPRIVRFGFRYRL